MLLAVLLSGQDYDAAAVAVAGPVVLVVVVVVGLRYSGGVHSVFPLFCGPGPGVFEHLRGHLYVMSLLSHLL